MKGRWRLTVRDEFSAAHALRNYQGKCERLHGHNFSVEVQVQGSHLDPETGMLLDFKILRRELKEVLSSLDHCVLNEQPPFETINPSSEHLSREIWRQMSEFLKNLPEARAGEVSLCAVTVAEKDRQSATYFE